GPYAFYLLSLEAAAAPLVPTQLLPPEARESVSERELPTLQVMGNWRDVFRARSRDLFEKALFGYMQRQPWFLGKERQPRSVEILDCVAIHNTQPSANILLVQVRYTEGEDRKFVVPVAFREGRTKSKDEALRETVEASAAVDGGQTSICRLKVSPAQNGQE